MALRWPILAAAAVLHALLLAVPAWLAALWRGEAPRPSLACGALLLLAGAWGAIEARWTSRHTRDAGANGRAPALQGALLWLLMVGAASRLLVAPGSPVAAGLVGLGIGLRLAAIRALGGHFRSRLDGAYDQRLITTGIYAWVRHPSELGNVCIVLGLAALAGAGPIVLLVAAAALLLVRVRVRAEDAALARSHGTRFAAHAAAVGACSPLRACASRLRGRPVV